MTKTSVADEIAFAALPADVQALARRVLVQDAADTFDEGYSEGEIAEAQRSAERYNAVCAERDALRPLALFAASVLSDWQSNERDGINESDWQVVALRVGVMHEVTRTVPCEANCTCQLVAGYGTGEQAKCVPFVDWPLVMRLADESLHRPMSTDTRAASAERLPLVGRCCIDAYILGWDECNDEYGAPSVPSDHDVAARIAESRDDDDDAPSAAS